MENQRIKKLNAPLWVILTIIAICIFVVIKFCPTNKPLRDNQLAALQQQHVADSIEALRRSNIYADTIAAIKKEKDRLNAQYRQDTTNLRKIISENKKLIFKYKSTSYLPVDSSAVLMPHEFVDDCKDCFHRLELTTDSISYYKYHADAMQALYISQSAIDSAHIEELTKEKIQLNKNYNDARMAAEAFYGYTNISPKWQIKTGISARLNDKFLPNGIGPGLMYEDKKDRNIAIKAVFGSGPASYNVDVFVPFKF